MRKFIVVVLALMSFCVMFVALMPMFDSQISIARAYPVAPRADAIVQPPCGEAEFNTAFNIVNNGGGTLTFNCGITTIFFTSQKVISADVTIDGDNRIVFNGNNSTRLFSVTAFQTLMLKNLTLTGGNGGNAPGGGLYNDGTATLINVTLSGNFAYWGGGLSNSGNATLTDVTIENNLGAAYGGGIENNGTVTLTNVTLSNNTAFPGFGGGIFNWSTATLTNVTFSGNYAHDSGGGIENRGTVTLNNVTLSGNWAAVGAGLANGGTANLTNVTLSNNLANHGSGISVYGPSGYTGTITLRNTIIANNSGGNCERQDVPNALLNSNGFNLSDDTTCVTYFNQPGDKNNLNAHLGGLANYGGPTLTHMPLRGSPLIDKGQCSTGTDQRGQPRPVGIACDIGAVERQPGDWDGYMYLPLMLK